MDETERGEETEIKNEKANITDSCWVLTIFLTNQQPT